MERIDGKEPFDRNNKSHMNILQSLYYSWYGPKAAAWYMHNKGIGITVQYITQMYRGFRLSGFPKYNRTLILKEYKPTDYPHIEARMVDTYFNANQ